MFNCCKDKKRQTNSNTSFDLSSNVMNSEDDPKTSSNASILSLSNYPARDFKNPFILKDQDKSPIMSMINPQIYTKFDAYVRDICLSEIEEENGEGGSKSSYWFSHHRNHLRFEAQDKKSKRNSVRSRNDAKVSSFKNDKELTKDENIVKIRSDNGKGETGTRHGRSFG